MKNLLLIILSLNSLYGYSQEKYFPDGVYLSLQELKDKKPSFNTRLLIKRRTDNEIYWKLGNQFVLISDSLDENFIRKRIYCYVKGDTILVNGKPQGIMNGFVLSETSGNFLVFQSGMAIANSKNNNAGIVGGIIGGAVGALATAAATYKDGNYDKSKYWYVLSLRTGNCKNFDMSYLQGRLTDFPTLNQQFQSDPDNKSYLTWIKYIQKINNLIQ